MQDENTVKGQVWERELCEMLASITDAKDMDRLLQDLCTYSELEQMAQRLFAAKMFLQGGTYNQIIEKTDISSATLSRVSRCIRHGSGGYGTVLKNQLNKANEPQ